MGKPTEFRKSLEKIPIFTSIFSGIAIFNDHWTMRLHFGLPHGSEVESLRLG